MCPVCTQQWGDSDGNMVCCDECNRWVHMECDDLNPAEIRPNQWYTCPVCRRSRLHDLGGAVDAALQVVHIKRAEIRRKWAANALPRLANFVTSHHTAGLAAYPQLVHVRVARPVVLLLTVYTSRLVVSAAASIRCSVRCKSCGLLPSQPRTETACRHACLRVWSCAVVILQLARSRLVALSRVCIQQANVIAPNPKGNEACMRRLACPEGRLINFNVLLRNFTSPPDPAVLAKARRFARRQLQPSLVAALLSKAGVESNSIPVIEVRASSLASNVSMNPMGWVVEAGMAASFLVVLSLLDPGSVTIKSLISVCQLTPERFVTEMLQVRGWGV